MGGMPPEEPELEVATALPPAEPLPLPLEGGRIEPAPGAAGRGVDVGVPDGRRPEVGLLPGSGAAGCGVVVLVRDIRCPCSSLGSSIGQFLPQDAARERAG